MKRNLRLLFLYVLAFLARPFVRRPAPAITRILYIKPDHLGDLLLATPVLAALRQRFPDARITALVGPWSQVVLRRNPDVDALATCPFPGFERPTTDDPFDYAQGRRRPTTDDGLVSIIAYRLSSIVYRLSSVAKPYWILVRYAKLLRATRYDLAIVGRDDHWWGAALALLGGVPARVGFAVPECRPLLSSALPWDPRAHVTMQGLALVESLVPGPLSFAESAQRQTRDKGQGTKDKGQFSARFDPAPADLSWADDWLRQQGVAVG